MILLSPFSDQELSLSDEALGELLLERYVARIADKNRLDPELLHPDFFRAVVDAIDHHDVEDARLASLEKALKKAAVGEFGSAGRLVRSFTQAGAEDMFIAKTLAEETAKNLRGPMEGAKKSAEARRKDLEPRNRKIRQQAEDLIGSGKKPADVKRILSDRHNLGPKQISRIIKEK